MKLDRLVLEWPAAFVREFIGRAQIDDVRHAELIAKPIDVARRERVQRITPEEHTPAQRSAPCRRVATQVTKIHTAIEVDCSFHSAGV